MRQAAWRAKPENLAKERARERIRRSAKITDMRENRPEEYRAFLDAQIARTRKRMESPEYVEKMRAYRGKFKKSPEAWREHIVRQVKSRADRDGIPFAMTEADLALPEFCPVMGTRLVYGGSPAQRQDTASVDKKIPNLGYIPGNVRVISYYANRMKQDCTDPSVFERLMLDARANTANSAPEPPLARKG